MLVRKAGKRLIEQQSPMGPTKKGASVNRKFARSAILLAMVSVFIARTTMTRSVPANTPGTITGQSSGVFIALSVADVDKVSQWYQEKLGFRVLSAGEAPNKIAKFALLEGDGSIIEIIQHRQAKPRSAAGADVKNAHLLHGIFKVGMVVKDLDGVYREVQKRGVPIAYGLMAAKDVPMRSFSVRDAEDNLIQFFGN